MLTGYHVKYAKVKLHNFFKQVFHFPNIPHEFLSLAWPDPLHTGSYEALKHHVNQLTLNKT